MRGAAPGALRELCMDLEDEIIFRCQSYAVLIKPAGDGLLLQCGPSLTTQALLHVCFSFLFSPSSVSRSLFLALLRKEEAIRGLLLELEAKAERAGL